MKLVVLGVIVGGCFGGPKPIGRFVRSITVQQDQLVLEVCMLEQDDGIVSRRTCELEYRPLPITAAVHATVPPAAILDEITQPMRDGVVACANQFGVRGPVSVMIRINFAGRLVEARPTGGGHDFADCAGSVLADAQFPRSGKGGRADLMLELAAPP